MPEDTKPPALDRGIFMAHFNRAKTLFEEKRYAESEEQLEEAYLLRPRDSGVLNLLGLVYFRQNKLEKSEEVYRKLVSQNPETPTLHHNLGLIYLKLNRLEESEQSLLKALELAETNAKISFYLGSVYEKQRRFQDAIFHYRRAGAHLMARRVEDKLAAAPPLKRHARRPDDTAELKVQEVAKALEREKEKRIETVSPSLMAEGAAPKSAETARFHKSESEAQTTEIFRFLQNNLLEVCFTGKVYIKQGTIYSYSGNLTFWVKEARQGGLLALVIVTGQGRLILTDKDREITLMHVDEEMIYIEPSHLLACEETLTPRIVRFGDDPIEFVAVEGRGLIALSVSSKPLSLSVTPDLPVSVPASSIITWSGALTARPVSDRQIYELMHRPGAPPTPLLRLEGTGRLLVEQSVKP
ncbi:MAG: tetratricopeptide repeat protein [Vicinamibacteria bacterium]|nr:tetratricopeptide repeat protein [Vicinamibacteria bacterium]